MDHAPHGDMHMQSDSLIDLIQSHTVSGTDVETISTPAHMLMTTRGPWTFMFHGEAFINAIQQSLAKAVKLADLSKVVVPANGVVLKVGRANIGSVIDPSVNNAEPLFTLTPLDGPVEAEFNVDAKDIGYIRPGDKVRIKLEAYRFTAHGTASGIIQTISDDSFTVNDQGQAVAPFYKVKVRITDDRLRDVPAGFRLTPGLTMTGEILIGRRTIMDYLFGGALRTGSEAMREPN